MKFYSFYSLLFFVICSRLDFGVCSQCEQGHYKWGNECLQCPSESDSAANSDDIMDCKCKPGFSPTFVIYSYTTTSYTFDTTASVGSIRIGAPEYPDLNGARITISIYRTDWWSSLKYIEYIELGSERVGPFLTGTGPREDCYAAPIAVLDNYPVAKTSWQINPTYTALIGSIVTSANYGGSSTCFGYSLYAKTDITIPYVEPSNHVCVPCPIGTSQESFNLESCPLCPAGKHAEEPGLISCILCEAGKYTNTAGVSSPCTPCEKGKYSNSAGSSQCTECPAHTYLETTGADDANQCEDCAFTRASYKGSTSKSDCICKYGFYADSATSCLQCVQNEYSDHLGAVECKTCEANHYTSSTRTGCIECPQNSNSASGSFNLNDCMCNDGYRTGTDSLCEICPIGKYSHSIYQQENQCYDCLSDKTSAAGSSAVSDCYCNAGWTGGGADIPCSKCPQGKFKSGIHNGACTECPSGTYLDSEGAIAATRCIDCPQNTLSLPGTTAEEDCICKVGYEEISGSCSACNNGYYKESTGQGLCNSCGVHKYSSVLAASSIEFCVCNAGYSGRNGDGACRHCEDGQYQPNPGGEPCINCPFGKYSTKGPNYNFCTCNAGSTGDNGIGMCSACDVGTYKTSSGSAPCDDCATGKFSAVTGSSTNVCECNAGTTGPNGAGTYCYECAVGKYKTIPGTVACTSCDTGKTLAQFSVDVCICNPGSTGPDNGDVCTQCDIGKFKSDTGSAPCSECWPGKTSTVHGSTTDVCTCNLGTTGEHGNQSCTDCAAGKYRADHNVMTCTNCSENEFSTTVAAASNVCQSCPDNAVSGEGSTACICDTGYVVSPDGACLLFCDSGSTGPDEDGICTLCEHGKYKSQAGSALCTECWVGKSSNVFGSTEDECTCNLGTTGGEGNQSCTKCAAGKYRMNTNVVPCINCSHNEFSAIVGAVSNVCRSCPAHASSSEGSTVCKCDVGYIVSDSGQCSIICDAGWTGQNEANVCRLCEHGKYKSESGPGLCDECWVGKSSNVTGSTMDVCTCNPGTTGGGGNQTCVDCAAGKYRTDTSIISCTNCSENEFSAVVGATSNFCQPCPVNAISGEGSTTCECDVGYIASDSGQCLLICDAGSTGQNEAGVCTPCEHGKYKSESGPSLCHECWVGKSSNVTGSTIDVCTCNPGTTGGYGNQTCIDCAAGKYRTNTNIISCTNCTRNEFSATVGATSNVCEACPEHATSGEGSTECICGIGRVFSESGQCLVVCEAGSTGPDDNEICTLCDYGKYKSESGSALCSECWVGKSSNVNGSIMDVCTCDLGTTGGSGNQTCMDCVAGKYRNDASIVLCTNCSQNEFSAIVGAKSDVCQACPVNAMSSEGSIACTCNPGYILSESGQCLVLCEAGSTGPDEDGICTLCGHGKYKSQSGSALCSECWVGKSLNMNGSIMDVCTCDLGTTGGSGNQTCVDCVAGKYRNDTNTVSCTKCPQNEFSVIVGAASNVCQSCPLNSMSVEGNTACTCNLGYILSDTAYCLFVCPTGMTGPLGESTAISLQMCTLSYETVQLENGETLNVTFMLQRATPYTVRTLLKSGGNWTVADKVLIHGNGISRLNPVILRLVGDNAVQNASQRVWQWSPVNIRPMHVNVSVYSFAITKGPTALRLDIYETD